MAGVYSGGSVSFTGVGTGPYYSSYDVSYSAPSYTFPTGAKNRTGPSVSLAGPTNVAPGTSVSQTYTATYTLGTNPAVYEEDYVISGTAPNPIPPPPTYTVSWNANGGSVSPSSNSGTSGTTVTAPTPTYTGYSFNGWYSAASGGSLIVNGGSTYTITSDTTLYAQWTALAPKIYNGTSFVRSTAKIWNGSAWTTASVKVWNGSSWINPT